MTMISEHSTAAAETPSAVEYGPQYMPGTCDAGTGDAGPAVRPAVRPPSTSTAGGVAARAARRAEAARERQGRHEQQIDRGCIPRG